MKQAQNRYELNLKLCTYENVASVLAVVYVLLGRCHKFLVLTVKKWLKSVYIYGSYRKIKTRVSLFWTTLYMLKVKGPDIYIPPLTGKPEQQRFTIRSGVQTSTSSMWRGTITGSGRPLSKPTLDSQ